MCPSFFSYSIFSSNSDFGSFVKGEEFPNDLDLLINYEVGGHYLSVSDGGILDQQYLRSYGMERTKPSDDVAFIWLTKDMKKVHRLNARCAPRTVYDL
ncbi:hypothetical protein V3O24_04435 [Methylobacter sp. Wu8]|uniref:hypothetical protein n=1 Tax=Methylobacter sp. Wu8 TaxID=3118457 RepID=UPI002F32567C